jgi:hypothetical protein
MPVLTAADITTLTAVSTGIMKISGDTTAKNTAACVLYLWFLW